MKKSKLSRGIEIDYLESFFICCFVFLLGVLVPLIYLDFYDDNKGSVPTEMEGCVNLSFTESVNCLNKEVRSFYKYNIDNRYLYWEMGKRNIKDWEIIKEDGGVCWHFAEYYVMRAKELGLESYYVELRGKKMNHALSIIANDNEYCVLDQNTLVGCMELIEE